MGRTEADDVELRGNGPLVALLGCVAVVMIGFGVALTVLPVYTERIHGLAGANRKLVTFHVGGGVRAPPPVAHDHSVAHR